MKLTKPRQRIGRPRHKSLFERIVEIERSGAPALRIFGRCPFCGSPEVHLLSTKYLPRREGRQVECLNCLARGPLHESSKAARIAWRHGEKLRKDTGGT